jgi:hypothetical protein
LEVFYAKFNPEYLVKFIQDHVESDVDFEIRQTYIATLDDKSTDPEDRKEFDVNIKEAEQKRPLLTEDLMGYLFKSRILSIKDGLTSLGWEDYFESDPMGEKYPKVKEDGIQKILIQMKVLKQKGEMDSSSSTTSSSSSSSGYHG